MTSQQTDRTGERAAEEILEPDLPICDAHHHLWLDRGHTGFAYTLADLRADTGTGHNIARTVFLECHAQYRKEGPPELRPVGEIEFVAEAAEQSAATPGPEIAGIVGHADLALGEAVGDVLAAEEEAGRGRFRGVRHSTAWDAGNFGNNAPRAGMLAEDGFRAGLRTLAARGHSFDSMIYHTQIPELTDVARAVPEVTVVANHLCVPIAGGPYRGRADEVRAFWRRHLPDLASCPNVVLKIGALIRPLSGERWDKRDVKASSEEIAAAWGDEIRFAIDTFGPSRCLFESNFPVDKACFGYVEVWNAFKRLSVGYSSDEKRDLFHDTAARAYRLPTIAV